MIRKNKFQMKVFLNIRSGKVGSSAKNVQEWKFMVVKDRKILKDLVPASKEQNLGFCVIAACSNETEYVMTCGQAAYVVDLSNSG